MEPVITIDLVHKRFADYVAVNRADLQVGRGAFFPMRGSSECGKSTTLRVIAGFEQPTAREPVGIPKSDPVA